MFSFVICTSFFYLGYVSPLFFISEETENALKQDSTSLLPACALKVTRSLSPQFSLDFNSPAKLFTSTASKLIEYMASDYTWFQSSITFIFLVFACSSFLNFVVSLAMLLWWNFISAPTRLCSAFSLIKFRYLN